MFEMVGALVPTYLVSRLFLWLLKKLRGDTLYFPLANCMSLALCVLLYGFGTGEGGFENRLDNMIWQGVLNGLVLYALPQAIWLGGDFWRAAPKLRDADTG